MAFQHTKSASKSILSGNVQKFLEESLYFKLEVTENKTLFGIAENSKKITLLIGKNEVHSFSKKQALRAETYRTPKANAKKVQLSSSRGWDPQALKTPKNICKTQKSSEGGVEGEKSFAVRQSQMNSTTGLKHRIAVSAPPHLLPAKSSPAKRAVLWPMISKRTSCKKLEKISIKDVIRDKEWVNKAKEQVIRDFNVMLNKSNGISIQSSGGLKYYIGNGNNSSLIKQLLSTRWWWTRVKKEDKNMANFMWTQWRDREFLERLPSLKGKQNSINANELPCSVRALTKYTVAPVNSGFSTSKIVDITPLGFNLISDSTSYTALVTSHHPNGNMQVHNRLEGNGHLDKKNRLFYNLREYYEFLGKDIFEVVPITFHVTSGLSDPKFIEFERKFNELSDTYWIVKPGENSNRGSGITLCNSLEQIRQLLNTPKPRSLIIQKYISTPSLIHKRKFDIRCFALITCTNGVVQGYFYQEGYLRTASKPFSLANSNKYIHLTNDAIQRRAEDYGKFENGNKLSYSDFQKYLDTHSESHQNFTESVLPLIKSIVRDTVAAVHAKINPLNRAHSFEIFGYDFLLDAELKPWLLEINTNPCLELSSPHLARIIPAMLENSFRIALDPLFPEPAQKKLYSSYEPFLENKYELIFSSIL